MSPSPRSLLHTAAKLKPLGITVQRPRCHSGEIAVKSPLLCFLSHTKPFVLSHYCHSALTKLWLGAAGPISVCAEAHQKGRWGEVGGFIL